MPPWLMLATVSPGAAADLHVGAGHPYADPQSAVDAAAPGDRIVIHAGIWPAFAIDRPVEVVGADGAAVTTVEAAAGAALVAASGGVSVRGLTLDGRGLGRALEVASGALVLQDSVLVDGVASDGGCVRVAAGASLVLRRAEVRGCSASGVGGAIEASGATLEIEASTVSSSSASRGGGLHLTGGSLVARGVTLSGLVANDASGLVGLGSGGGVDLDGATASLVGIRAAGCEARSVRAGGGIGGAVYSEGGDLSILGSIFEDNVATERGSAVAIEGGTGELASSRIADGLVDTPDPTPTHGGALFCGDGSRCAVDGVWFEGNAGGDGGGISSIAALEVSRSMFCRNVSTEDAGAADVANLMDPSVAVSFVGNVFAGNTAPIDGGALAIQDLDVRIENNTFLANAGGAGGAILGYADQPDAPALLILVNNLYVGNAAGVGGSTLQLDGGVPGFEGYEWFFASSGGHFDGTPGPGTVLDQDPLLAAWSDCLASSPLPPVSSPILDAGDPGILDPDGSRSDIGASGGPGAAPDVFLDADGDGFAAMVDCDDTDSAVHPDATESCNGIDDDCDGLVDGDDLAIDARWQYPDADGDGAGDAAGAALGCPAPDRVLDGTDCDDTDATLGSPIPWHTDSDGDGYGDGAAATEPSCTAPDGTVADGTDCDDTDPDIHPGAEDLPGDGLDADCNGVDGPLPDGDADTDTDADSDADTDTDTDTPQGLDSDGDGVVDSVDPAPLDAGGVLRSPGAPPASCGCATARGAALPWLLSLLGLAAARRRRQAGYASTSRL